MATDSVANVALTTCWEASRGICTGAILFCCPQALLLLGGEWKECLQVVSHPSSSPLSTTNHPHLRTGDFLCRALSRRYPRYCRCCALTGLRVRNDSVAHVIV